MRRTKRQGQSRPELRLALENDVFNANEGRGQKDVFFLYGGSKVVFSFFDVNFLKENFTISKY